MMKVLPWMYNHDIIANIKPEYRYDGKEPFEVWQKKAKEKLYELLGMKNIRKADDTHFTIEHVKETDEYTEYRFTLESEVGYVFPSVMRVPKGIEGMLLTGKLVSVSPDFKRDLLPDNIIWGQAAGVAAAVCIRKGITPRELEADVSEVQDILRNKYGAILDGVK